jgi:DNA-binding transcriptional MocR family regulator
MTRAISPDRLARLVGDFDRSPAYVGLRDALQELIGDGRIPLGTRLPSERAVTGALGVSRTTVTRAYSDLVASGYATARQGSGTFAAVPISRRRAHDRALQPLGRTQPLDDQIDLNCAASAAAPGVAAAYERAVAALPAYLGTDGYLPSGLPQLQAVVADSFVGRGLPTSPEQIVVTSGALSGIAVVARALSRPGDRVMVESPVYPNAIGALRLGGARVVSSPLADPLGDTGWDLDGVEATLRQTSPHLAYLIPDFQNPTGFLMGESDRERYARATRAARTTPIVDETLQPTGLTGDSAPAPFAAYAADAVTIGSASKMFWGGLRVGWIRAPHALVDRIVAARVHLDLGSSLLDQLVVAELLASGAVLAARREHLREGRDALARALDEQLPEWRYRLPGGGLSLWVRLPHGSATRLAAEAERAGVYLAPGPVFAVEGGSDAWLRIPYTKSAEDLRTAVGHLADAWARTDPGPATSREPARVLIA